MLVRAGSRLPVRLAGRDGLYLIASAADGLALLNRIDAEGRAVAPREALLHIKALEYLGDDFEATLLGYPEQGVAGEVADLRSQEDLAEEAEVQKDQYKHIREKKPGLEPGSAAPGPEDVSEALPAVGQSYEPGVAGKTDLENNKVIADYMDQVQKITDYALGRVTAPMNKGAVKARVLASLFENMFLLDEEIASGAIPEDAKIITEPTNEGIKITFQSKADPNKQYSEMVPNASVYSVEAFLKQSVPSHVLNIIGAAELATIAPMVAKTAERINKEAPIPVSAEQPESKDKRAIGTARIPKSVLEHADNDEAKAWWAAVREHSKLTWALKKSVWENYLSKMFISPRAKNVWRAAVDRAATATDYESMVDGLSRRLSEIIGGANDVGGHQLYTEPGSSFVKALPAVGSPDFISGLPAKAVEEGEKIAEVLNFENYRKYIVNELALGSFTGGVADDFITRMDMLSKKLGKETEEAETEPAPQDRVMDALISQLEKIKIQDDSARAKAEAREENKQKRSLEKKRAQETA